VIFLDSELLAVEASEKSVIAVGSPHMSFQHTREETFPLNGSIEIN